MNSHATIRLAALALALLALLAAPLAAVAHLGQDALVHVPRDFVNPGDEFPILAADLDPDAEIPITLVYGTTVLDLGHISTDGEGHYEGTLRMPESVPHGYVQIIATSPDSGEVAGWIRVGPREGLGPVPADPAEGLASLADPSVLMLLLLVGGVMVALGAVLLRSARGGRRRAKEGSSAPSSRSSLRRP